jgi:predicted CoA-binding protein
VTRSPEQILFDAKTIAALQLGIVSAEARAVAETGGLDCVEDACTLVVHRGLS